jgi:hypothetical protein
VITLALTVHSCWCGAEMGSCAQAFSGMATVEELRRHFPAFTRNPGWAFMENAGGKSSLESYLVDQLWSRI